MGLRKNANERHFANDGDNRSPHLRIAAEFRDRILNGDIAPGAKLPSTQKIMDEFGASTTSVQNAMRTLKEEDLVVGQAGKAITAREHRVTQMRPASYFAAAEPGQPYRWIADARRRGMTAEIELLEVSEVVPPASIARALGIEADDVAVLRYQLLKLNGEPAELVENYYPVEIARGTAIAQPRKIRGGVPTLLAEMGYPFRRAVDAVSARTPTVEQGVRLKMPAGELPVLRTFRTVFTDNDRVTEVTVMAKAGHLYELSYEIS